MRTIQNCELKMLSLRAFFFLPMVVAWKPIVGPPAAFTLKQTLPALATSTLGDQFLDTQSQAAANPYIESEERILNGKFAYGANSIFNTGLTGPLVKIPFTPLYQFTKEN